MHIFNRASKLEAERTCHLFKIIVYWELLQYFGQHV